MYVEISGGRERVQLNLKRDGRRLAAVCAAALVSAFNLRAFVNGAGLFPGGATGMAVLLQSIADKYLQLQIPYAVLNLALNAVPVWIGFKFIGKKFTLLSLIYVVLSSVLTDLLPPMQLTDNSLLLAVFGGIIGGFAISLCLNADATSGGTDFISIYMSERRGVDFFGVMLGCNVAMLAVAGLLFSWERALYSIIYQYVSTQVVQTLFARYQKQTLFIVTREPEKVYQIIRETTHHAATLLRGEGLYEQQERYMLYSVVSRAEARRLVERVRAADEGAFINSIRTQALSGRFYQRPND